MKNINIRTGELKDKETLVKFNIALAKESEKIKLSNEVVEKGVEAVLQNSNLGFYLLAEKDEQIIASLMITNEWSDWRNGMFWWIQSVYVLPDYRRKGIYSKLYEHIKELVSVKANVLGFRLYVEKNNNTAITTYKSLGMKKTAYRLFEEIIE
ncbi:MAG: GNAT family N-acetyltransferase [Ignavibacteria bacterium GWB2_35_12]|nr:MAG: GNAT family N-acetyltransferase [Ignavibacteria bacterium GWA2_35_8]OGU39272.1 MAG: GNAT family N-acetyltransferase [Ignavibacteria bacterium GWB2_35_12]OGU89468.1 MAG: GNAT family N-acetyltransferase [Ignavibacteria bacterium RIFOXYA2_FULL_35_10]OGV21154.1 MAG: GNAT family N-acetyltransferase [Ignavibacteria bacterium RIFOXYC2_FULL_35_21]